ncbi:MAG TPA: type IV secretion system DNA-binding domain-containing protein, partial [Candidatus Binataceae bacterium]|nr:type IV secretion system DNA-binding domain-containing protein [Candidatus Binataceae bacterium]
GVLMLWAVLTSYVIWYATGQYFPQLQHLYFGQWMLCGILTRSFLASFFVPWCKVPMNGTWYPILPLTDWLNGPQLYHQPFTVWFWHYGFWTASLPIALALVSIAWRARHVVDRDHIRGLRLLTPKDHNRQSNGGWFERRQSRGGMKLGVSVIAPKKESEHFLITGSPGAGKSTLIRHMLTQIQERGQSAIVIDPDCEFVQEFYDEERGDVVLNPLDARCPFWSPWAEFRDDSFPMDAESMAASLIRTQAKNASEEFFRESGRTLLESIFNVVKERRHASTITDFLSLSREDIQQKLKGTRAYPLIDPGAHEQGSGIIATAANAVKPFAHLPERKQTSRAWSAREWASSREGWVFLSSREDARAAIQRLQGVWLDSLVRWLMSAEIGSGQVWIMADELPAMEYQPQIEKLITRGRKRGLSAVLGFQNVSQLRSIYGADGAITLTSSPTTKVILRCDEAETAKWASELLGSREVERINMTQLAGLSTMREGVNLQPQRTSEHIVTAAEIQMLKPFHGYLCVAGSDRTTITITERHLERKQSAFLPRNKVFSLPAPAKRLGPLSTSRDEV